MSDDFVTREELEHLMQKAVRTVLDEYDFEPEHDCIMHLRPGDSEYIRDLIGCLREIGDGSLEKGIAVARENHKFVRSLQKVATKIGWGVIVIVASVLGSLGMIAFGVVKNGGGS